MNWFYYLVEANVYLCVFFALFHFALKNETRYVLNRWYLLVISSLSFLLPFLAVRHFEPIATLIPGKVTNTQILDVPSIPLAASKTVFHVQQQSDIRLTIDMVVLF